MGHEIRTNLIALYPTLSQKFFPIIKRNLYEAIRNLKWGQKSLRCRMNSRQVM